MPATLALVRIDDRLIHGQVAIGWVKASQPDILVVANDAVAADPVQQSLMEMAAPAQLGVIICPVAEVVELSQGGRCTGKRLLILFSTVQDVLSAVEAGLPLKALNIGGMRFQPGKEQVLKAVALNEADKEAFRQLLARGVKATVQMVPTDEALDIRRWVEARPVG